MESKPFWQSRTLWGAVSLVAVSLAQAFGYDIGDANGWTSVVLTLIGGVVTVVGRVKAVKRIQ
jgi:uncharacterized membrane protein YhaH (DUF805 family)